MRVVWSPNARKNRNKIARYIEQRFGSNRKEQFLLTVRQTTLMLKRHPNIGPLEPLFADRTGEVRSVVIGGLSKMVYYLDGDTVFIAAFWDCRQDPEAQTL